MDNPSPSAVPEEKARLTYWHTLSMPVAVVVGLLAMFWAGDQYGRDGVLVVLAAVVFFWLLCYVWFRIRFGRQAWWILLLGLLGQCGGCLVTFKPLGSYFVNESRSACADNLHQIGVALQAYYATHGTFPPAYVADAAGKPILSWRVLILPNMGLETLHDRFDFHEPWDGPHNRGLSNHKLPLFHCSRHRRKGGTTISYLAVTGPNTAWPGATGSKLEDFSHGPANTILLVEVVDSGIASWAEPRDLEIRDLLSATSGPLPSSNHYGGGFNALFADGSVRYLDWNQVRARLGPDAAVIGDLRNVEFER